MGVREDISRKKGLSVGLAVALLLVAGVMFFRSGGPKRPNLALSYYSDDDGQTWFSDSALRIPPFDHNGKEAVGAQIFTYAEGSKQFCAYLTKYTPDAKRRLEESAARATANGQPPSLELLLDPKFVQAASLVKSPGPGHPWMQITDPRSSSVCDIHSPDGSTVDAAYVY